jgi:cysteine desulfurase
MIYFDWNATAPLSPEAREAWLQACEQFPGNPSSPHRLGSRAEHALEEARAALAEILGGGCHAADLVFTSGATESNNTVLAHVARTTTGEVWLSAIEHPSVLASAAFWLGARLKLIPVTRDGVVDVEWLQRELAWTRPAVVGVMAANNETGVLQPWPEVMRLCREAEIPFFCDAVQWLGRMPSQEEGTRLGDADWLSASAHKFGGPRGVGILKVPRGVTLAPLLHGGGQESGRRAGTENVAGVLSTVAALKVAVEHQMRVASEGMALRDRFERQLREALPGVEIVAGNAPRLWNTVSALMPEAGCQQRWVVKLDRLGLAVSTGSACASGSEKPSHVLTAMGYSAAESSRALRCSSGPTTTAENWNALLHALTSIARTVGK